MTPSQNGSLISRLMLKFNCLLHCIHSETKLVHQGVKFVLNPSILDGGLAHTNLVKYFPFRVAFFSKLLFCLYHLSTADSERLSVSILFEMFSKLFYSRTAGSEISNWGDNPSNSFHNLHSFIQIEDCFVLRTYNMICLDFKTTFWLPLLS